MEIHQSGHIKGDAEMSLSVCKLQVLCAQVGFFRHAVGFQTAGVLLCNKLPVHIVTVCNPDAALLKQQTLTMRIFFKAPMLVRSDMIRLQICKNTEIEYKALGPVEHQRLRGNLHYNGIAARFHHFGKIFLQKIRFRRRIDRVNMRVSDNNFNGSDQSYLSSRIFQDGFYQISGRRLALRAGDAHEAHLPLRMIKERLADSRHCRAAVAHQHLRHVHIVQEAFHYQCHAAILHRLRGILMRIKMCAGKAEEDAVFGLFPAVGTQRRNLHGHIAPGFQQVRHFLDKLSQFHRQLAPLFVIPGHQQKNRCAGLYIFSRCRALLCAQPLPRHGHH